MSDLRQLQNNFQHYLLQQHSHILDSIISTEKISAEQRLDIYRDAYTLRLLDVLTLDYPVLRQLLGSETFEKTIRDYIFAKPSVYQSVRWYGNQLPDYIQSQNNSSLEPIFIEMAYFENALTQVFDEREDAIVTLEYMSTIPFEQWPSLCFRLQYAFVRLNFNWNVIPTWNAVNTNEEYAVLQALELMPVMIWRKEMEVQFCSLTVDEAYTIDAMLAGKTFGEICEGLCEWIEPDNVGMHAAMLLKRFIMDELIAEIIITA